MKGLCARVGFSRQAFYQEKKARKRKQVDKDAVIELVKSQRRIHPRMGTRKLYRIIKPDLNEMGLSIGRDHLFRMLREADLLIERRVRYNRTTYSNHSFRVYSNLIRHIEPFKPNQVWLSDLTYIFTEEGYMYLSLITDAFSRKIVGFDISDSLEFSGCLRSLRMALSGLKQSEHPIHHSDRGAQYCCKEYVKIIESRDMLISMTESNHCYENAKAERVNGILKQEYFMGARFRSKSQAIEAARQAIQIYNEMRPHLSLDYRTPSQVHLGAAA